MWLGLHKLDHEAHTQMLSKATDLRLKLSFEPHLMDSDDDGNKIYLLHTGMLLIEHANSDTATCQDVLTAKRYVSPL